MPHLIDLSNYIYGKLTVISYAGKAKGRKSLWLCKCECGSEKIVSSGNLRSGNSTSCGCQGLEKIKKINATHGMSNLVEYKIWTGIKQRCTNSGRPDYNNYGGRGIRICDRWLGESGFFNFISDMGLRPSKKHSVERKDNENGHYDPENCIWGTKKEQDRNKRSNRWIEYNGERMILEDWATFFNLKKSSCLSTYLKDHSMEEAFIHYAKQRDYKHKKSNVWIEHDGKRMIISDWARYIGIRTNLFWLKRKTMTLAEIIGKYKK